MSRRLGFFIIGSFPSRNSSDKGFRDSGSCFRLKQSSIELQYRVLNFNTGLDPRFKISGKLFCRGLNLESWIPASIEVQYTFLKFNIRYGTSTISLNFNTGLDPRFKISGKLFCGALNLEAWIQAHIEFNHINEIQYWVSQA